MNIDDKLIYYKSCRFKTKKSIENLRIPYTLLSLCCIKTFVVEAVDHRLHFRIKGQKDE